MKQELQKKYGLPTAIGMVVGIVIGSGIFFKAEAVLTKTGGNMPLGILAWLIVGCIMIACTYVFASMANRFENISGVVDYAKAILGKRYAYNMGWFLAVIYLPAITSVLAWVSARYTCSLFGFSANGGECMTISCLYLCAWFVLNALAPKLAGVFQVSTTIIKLIPLFAMAILGTIVGVSNGSLIQNFTSPPTSVPFMEGLTGAIVSIAFAFDGWITATYINGELKDAKRNLPLALVGGLIIVVITYVLYYIGINGAVSVEELLTLKEGAVKLGFVRVFGNLIGNLIFVFIVISCLGTLNGVTLANTRGFYSLAANEQGPKSDLFKQIDPITNMPTNSAIISLFLAAIWLFYFYGANLSGGWFGVFSFDSSELPIITLYGMYIPMFVQFMRTSKDLSFFSRFVMPILGLVGCSMVVASAFISCGVQTVIFYLILYVIVMLIGNIFYNKNA